MNMWSVPRRRYHGHWEEEESSSPTSSQPRRMRGRRMKLLCAPKSPSGHFGAIWTVTVLAAILVALVCGPHQVAAAASRRTMLAMASDRGNSLLHEPATDCRLGMNKSWDQNFHQILHAKFGRNLDDQTLDLRFLVLG
jgi:hypothetical protein